MFNLWNSTKVKARFSQIFPCSGSFTPDIAHEIFAGIAIDITFNIITQLPKYLQSDWLRGRQYSPYLCKERNMTILHSSGNM